MGLVSLIGHISFKLCIVGRNGLIGFISLFTSLVGIGLNGLISISIEMSQSQHYSLVREKDEACADFHTLLRPDSHLGDATQMTKYFFVRECENIPTWISLCLTTVFSQQGGISVFKFPKRFFGVLLDKDLTLLALLTLLTL